MEQDDTNRAIYLRSFFCQLPVSKQSKKSVGVTAPPRGLQAANRDHLFNLIILIQV